MHRALNSYAAAGVAGDEAELLKRYATIVERLVRRLVARTGMTSAADDLRSAGTLGLIEAARRFDPARGASFETFAERRIRGAMLDELRRQDHLPRRLRTQANDVAARRREMTQALGRQPTAEELADDLDMTIEELAEMDNLGEQQLSLDWLMAMAGGNEQADEPIDPVARVDASRALARAIGELPERLRTVLSLIYIEDLDYAEVGELLGVSKPRVCQLHGDAIGKLRAALA